MLACIARVAIIVILTGMERLLTHSLLSCVSLRGLRYGVLLIHCKLASLAYVDVLTNFSFLLFLVALSCVVLCHITEDCLTIRLRSEQRKPLAYLQLSAPLFMFCSNALFVE